MSAIRLLTLGVITLGLGTGCSGGGGGGGNGGASVPPPATTSVRVYYDAPANTQLKEEGLVLVGTDGKPSDTKHGTWKTYFHPDIAGEKNILESEKTYEQGTWNRVLLWTLYNPDTSIRDSGYDATH
jgi:hypothetical protein